MLIDVRDAGDVFAALGIRNAGGGQDRDARFASRWFGRWHGPPLPVEIMAGFRVRGIEGWVPVSPTTHEPVRIGSASVFVPDADELRALLLRFDRPKDHARAAALAVTASTRTRTC